MRRFVQADTIVPEPGNPQSLNRYAYVNNNPAAYVDPDGHLALLATAGVGALVGAGFAYGAQVVENRHNGQSLNEAALNFDWGSVAAGAAGGAIMGLTMGAASVLPLGFWGTMAVGSAGGVVAGQGSALAEAGFHQVRDVTIGEQWDSAEFQRTAFEAGFGDAMTIGGDILAGGASAAAGFLLGECTNAVLGRYGDQVIVSDPITMIGMNPNTSMVSGVKLVKQQRTITLPASKIENAFKAVASGAFGSASEIFEEALEEAIRDGWDSSFR